MKKLKFLIKSIILMPHVIIYKTHVKKDIIECDVIRWLEITNVENNLGFVGLMIEFPEFRNLFYKRIGKCSRFIKWLCPELSTLYIETNDIGPGLFIQHGFATIIAAKSIGMNCWINQQVTIGYSNNTDAPTLGDNVTINAGAKVIGKLYMGDFSKAGANAVVVKDVPNNCVVVGVPAYIIRRNGIRVNEKL